jgi:protein-L-isoaspartate(D-aspartate) O-methyltransferase
LAQVENTGAGLDRKAMGSELKESELARRRHHMVQDQLRRRGIADERVLAAMESVPRHLFVPETARSAAYEDGPLPIGTGQTISQPYMVALMTEILHPAPDSRVLEIGTGSGYQTAVLAELAGEVTTIERLPELAEQARALLRRLGYANVRFITGDGTLGFPEGAPYQGIMVTAGAPRVPQELRAQVAVGGMMVIPVTAGDSEDLLLIERLADRPAASPDVAGAPATVPQPQFRETSVLKCTFVPLIGEQGYAG